MQNQLASSTSNVYYHEINFVRAIAALAVVMVHVTAANYHLNDKTLDGILLFLNQISRFGTPFFALISGFLLYNQAIKNRYNFKKFVKSRLTKVVIPFIIWSFIYLLINSYSFSNISNLKELKEFLYYFFTGKSSYHLYFIAVVIQFYLLFPFIQRLNSKRHLFLLTIIGLYLNYFHIVTPFEIGTGLIKEFTRERAFIFYWLFYFFLGGLLVHYWKNIVTKIRENLLLVTGLGFTALLFMSYDYMTSSYIKSSTRPANLINVPILLLSFTGLYYLLDKLKGIRKLLLMIGNFSMGIYLVHPLIIFIIRENIPWMLKYKEWIPLSYILIVFCSILTVKLIHRLPLGDYIVIIARRKH